VKGGKKKDAYVADYEKKKGNWEVTEGKKEMVRNGGKGLDYRGDSIFERRALLKICCSTRRGEGGGGKALLGKKGARF